MNKALHSVIVALTFVSVGAVHAQDSGSNAAAQANNPLANTTAFNIQNYYIDELTGTDENANQLILRYAKPVSVGDTNWIMRASLPFNSYPVGVNGAHEAGLGDFDIFAAYLIDTGSPGISFGVGPQVVAPTASEDPLGSEQWQLGLANVYFNATSAKYQYGYLLIYRGGVGDTNGRQRVNLMAFQPFAFLQLGKGWYTGTAPIWNYDLSSDNYGMPLGLRLGKVLPTKDVVFNTFIEPQVSVADRGPGQPEFQLFFALNMQF